MTCVADQHLYAAFPAAEHATAAAAAIRMVPCVFPGRIVRSGAGHCKRLLRHSTGRGCLLSSAAIVHLSTDMIETNPIRQRAAELLDRLAALRGYL